MPLQQQQAAATVRHQLHRDPRSAANLRCESNLLFSEKPNSCSHLLEILGI
jgi:hypothetical protein